MQLSIIGCMHCAWAKFNHINFLKTNTHDSLKVRLQRLGGNPDDLISHGDSACDTTELVPRAFQKQKPTSIVGWARGG